MMRSQKEDDNDGHGPVEERLHLYGEARRWIYTSLLGRYKQEDKAAPNHTYRTQNAASIFGDKGAK